MIIYDKLMKILEDKKMTKKQFSESIGIKTNTMAALSKNRNVNTDTLNRICEYLHVQPSEIMEWMPDSEYEKVNADKILIENQIAELQAKLKKLS